MAHSISSSANFDKRVEGPWTNFPERDLVANYPSNLKYQVISFASDAINWSSTMTFGNKRGQTTQDVKVACPKF